MQRKEVMRREHAHCTKKARPASAGRAAASRNAQPQAVRIEFHDEQAQSVSIIGTFNNWNTEGTHMLRVQPGRWLRMLFLPPGRYEYLFLVDGRCVADPHAIENVPNVYGCMNSVLSVPSTPPRNGCARIVGRKPARPLRTTAKLISRSCGRAPRPLRSRRV